MEDKLKQAVSFFTQEVGFKRLLQLLIEKYRGLGRLGGSVKLTNLKTYEQELLSSFFRKDYSKQKSVTISFLQFTEALAKTKFAGVDLKELLDQYAGEEILTKAEEQGIFEEKKDLFFQGLMEKFSHPYCQSWLKNIRAKGPGTRGIHQSYEQNPERLKVQLGYVLSAISRLPEEGYERLPVFAHRITKNPHGFDIDNDQGKMLLLALQWIRRNREEQFNSLPSPSAEEVTEIFHYFRIVRDDIQNFVTCAGIMGFSDKGKPLPVWQAAAKDACVLNVPLRELIKVSKCMPAINFESGDRNIVFVIENSGVFSAIIDYFQAIEDTLPPIICTHGQFKLAALVLLDKLAEIGTTIFYSGDFDPEGLQMAQRLIQRYSTSAKPWRYQVEDYEQALSSLQISDSRLKKLDSISEPSLISVKEEIIKRGLAGYQEELIDKMINDISELLP